MPPPFRRSCQQCVRAKRRCDLAAPCHRCRVRSLPCAYTAAETDESPAEASAERHPDWAHSPRLASGEAIDAHFLAPFPDYSLDWSDIMTDIHNFAVPDQVGSNESSPARTITAGSIYQQRVVYSVEQLKAWPGLFAQKAHIPFINAQIYADEMPNIIREVLGVCCLYAHKTSHNDRVVLQCLREAAGNLTKRLSASRETSAAAQMHSMQALCLYQIMQLFDGDIALRADAENAMPLLKEHLQHLKCLAQPAHADASPAGGVARGSQGHWLDWVSEESIRRTLLVGFAIQGLYCFLKQGWDDSHDDFVGLSFHAQAALWSAKSAYTWAIALETTPCLPVRIAHWDSDVVNARPTDIDNLGMVLMALSKGVEYCCHWAGSDHIGRFGLNAA